MALSSTENLRQQLRNLAARETRLAVLTGMLRVIIAIVVFAVLFFVVDWMLRLSVFFRFLSLAGGLAGLIGLIRAYLVLPLRIERNEETEALKLEHHFPYLNDRLISVIQLTGTDRETEENAMSRALIQRLETDISNVSAQIKFSDVIDWRFIRRIGLIAGGIFFFAFLSYMSFPEYVMITVKRMFLSSKNYPVLTHIKLKGYDDRIVEGDDWNIRVSLSGEIPSTVTLLRKKTGTNELWEEFEFKPGLGYQYSLTLKKVLDSFEFKVVAGDGTAGPVPVTVLDQLTVSDPLLDITPPAYTGIQPVTRASIRSSSIVEDSNIRVIIPANKQIVSGTLITSHGTALSLIPHETENTASAEFIAARRYEPGKAIQFDGVGQVAKLPFRESFNPGKNNEDFTVEFWLYLRQHPPGAWRSLLHKGGNNKERTFKMSLHPNSNRIHYRISTSASWNEGGDSASEIPLKKWTHIVYVKKDNTLQLYMNGEQDSEIYFSGSVNGNKGTTYIGNSPWERGVNGAMDQLLVYGRALSRAEIRTHYNRGRGTPSFSRKELMVGYLFDGTAEDMSGNGYTLELVNKPSMEPGIVRSLAMRDGKPIVSGRNGIISFTVRLKDTDGLQNAEPLVRYSFRIRSDRNPRIRVTYPDIEKTSVPFAEWEIEYTASDDFGVCKAWMAWGIHQYSLDAAADESDSEYDDVYAEDDRVTYLRQGRRTLEVPEKSLRFTARALLKMLALNVSPGQAVDVWIEAADARVRDLAALKRDSEITPGFSVSNPVRFIVVDRNRKWLEFHDILKEIEKDVIQIKDNQENIKNDTRKIKKKLK